MPSSISAPSASSIPSDVPAVRNVRSGVRRKTASRVLRGNRLTSRCDARRWSVAVVPVAQRPLHSGNQVRRRVEPESHRVADVQVAHTPSAGFDPLRFDDDVADGVGKAAQAGSDRDRRRGVRGGHVSSYRDASRNSCRDASITRTPGCGGEHSRRPHICHTGDCPKVL